MLVVIIKCELTMALLFRKQAIAVMMRSVD